MQEKLDYKLNYQNHRRVFSQFWDVPLVAKLHSAPDKIPTMTDDHGLKNPDDGVAATRPAMVPEQKPTIVHRRSIRKSRRHQTIPPNDAAIIVFHTAKIARRFAPKALPPLKPIHPNHSMKAFGIKKLNAGVL